MQRSNVVVTDAIVHIQLARYLPRILCEQVVAVHINQPLRITRGERRRNHLAGHKVSQRLYRAAISIRIVGVTSLRSIERERPKSIAEVELIQLRLAILAAKPELMCTYVIRQCIRHMTGNVVTALGRRLTRPIESGD